MTHDPANRGPGWFRMKKQVDEAAVAKYYILKLQDMTM